MARLCVMISMVLVVDLTFVYYLIDCIFIDKNNVYIHKPTHLSLTYTLQNMNEEDRAEVQTMVDDLYKLDYEDIVAGEGICSYL